VCVNMRYEHKVHYVFQTRSESVCRPTRWYASLRTVSVHTAHATLKYICVHVSSSFLIHLGLGVRKHTVVFDFTHGVALAIVGLHM
jgi:hypothetical protein